MKITDAILRDKVVELNQITDHTHLKLDHNPIYDVYRLVSINCESSFDEGRKTADDMFNYLEDVIWQMNCRQNYNF